jgi:hypothetical protein
LGSYRPREIELLRLGHEDQDVISILEVGLIFPAGGALPTNNVRCNGVRSIICRHTRRLHAVAVVIARRRRSGDDAYMMGKQLPPPARIIGRKIFASPYNDRSIDR